MTDLGRETLRPWQLATSTGQATRLTIQMKKENNDMRRELAVESTTLPDGPIISVARVTNITKPKSGKDEDIKESAPQSEVSARHADVTIRMKVAQMSPLALRSYLDLTVKELEKQRQRLLDGRLKPYKYDPPKDFAEFTATMAHHEMLVIR